MLAPLRDILRSAAHVDVVEHHVQAANLISQLTVVSSPVINLDRRLWRPIQK